MLDTFRDRKISADLAKSLPPLKIMHVCGTHEYVISRFGLRNLLPDNLEIISGPGCPVCCTPAFDIDALVGLCLKKNVVVTCYGDMLRVRGSKLSLAEAKAEGGAVRIVYSILNAIEFAKSHKDLEVVHSAIGFETTAPTTAAVLTPSTPANFSVISSHRLIPPAMEFLLKQKDSQLDGFIAPGHVSVIIGGAAYKRIAKRYNRPIVITGFEPVDILYSIYLILRQIKQNRPKAEIEYSRAVTWQPQEKAVKLLKNTFDIADSFWRGLGEIPGSGLVLKKRFQRFDALSKFKLKRRKRESNSFKNCRCADVLKGKISPYQCPAFANKCKPEHPLGPCMVSNEGSCGIYYRYRVREQRD